jgi:hypothetical protein
MSNLTYSQKWNREYKCWTINVQTKQEVENRTLTQFKKLLGL